MKANNGLRSACLAGNLPLAGLSAALLWLLPAIAHAQAIEAWVQRYNGPGNGSDVANALAVDASGNVYVTGVSESDCLTIEYSSTGLPLWTNRYNGPGNNTDIGNAVVVDATGNVYVTGVAYASGLDADYLTIQYSDAGVPLWTNRYDGPGDDSDNASALAVDASGNVYVTGHSSGSSSGWDYATIKYSDAGLPLWVRRYNGPGNGADWANAVAVDAGGDVYVTGHSRGSDSLPDFLTIKYSGEGVPLWTNRYNGPANGDDQAHAMAVDASGNVYVTGESAGSGSGFDFATIKYSSAGTPLWTNRYNGPANGNDWANALAVDSVGNAYVTGDSYGIGSSSDYATIAYSSAGIPLWTNRYNGSGNSGEEPTSIATDDCGNVYVTGYSSSSSSGTDYATVAYSNAGSPLWTNRYNGPGNGLDEATAVAADAKGNVFVTGRSHSGSNLDVATIKYVVPPIITCQPLSQTNAVGTTTSFTVEAMGSLPLGFQWRRTGTNLVDGGNLCGIATTNLQIVNVQLADACGYSVVVTNAWGRATSHVAQLTVVSVGRFSNLSYSPVTGFSFVFCDATVGQPYRIQRSPSLAEGSWVDWQSFTYTEPNAFLDLGATTTTNRFYRAVSP